MEAILSNKIFWFIAIPVVLLGALAAALPSLLNLLGLNRPYPGRSFHLSGKRALIIATNHDILAKQAKRPAYMPLK